jgi:hypothetical protein
VRSLVATVEFLVVIDLVVLVFAVLVFAVLVFVVLVFVSSSACDERRGFRVALVRVALASLDFVFETTVVFSGAFLQNTTGI